MNRCTGWAALVAAGFILALGSAPARADIIGADFHESLDLPQYRPNGPRILQRLGVTLPSAPPQLTAADEIANPSSWNNALNVSFDSPSNTLSLSADGGNTYQIITITLDNLHFDSAEQVVGITPLVTNSAVTADTGAYTISTSFTATSFTVTYSVDLATRDLFDINPQPALDEFQVLLGPSTSAVPEPSSVLMLCAGIIGVAGLSRRRGRKPSAS